MAESCNGLAGSSKEAKKPSQENHGDRFIPSRAGTNYNLVHSFCDVSHPTCEWMFNVDQPSFTEALDATSLPEKTSRTPRTPRILKYCCTSVKTATSPFLDPGRVFAENLRALSPKMPRKIREDPNRILTAPGVINNRLFTPVGWSKRNILSVGLGEYLFFTEVAPDLLDGCQSSPQVVEVGEISEMYRSIQVIEWDENGDKLAVGNRISIELVDGETEQKLFQVRSEKAKALSLAWCGSLLACGGDTGCLYVSDIRSESPSLSDIKIHSKGVVKLAWGKGQKVASGCEDGYVKYWDLRSMTKPIQSFKAHSGAVKALSWCPWNTQEIATGGLSNPEDKSVKFWIMENGLLKREIDVGGPVISLCWNEENRELAMAQDNFVQIWDCTDFSYVGKLTDHLGDIIATVQSGDETSIASLGADEVLCIWKCWPKVPKKEVAPARCIAQRCLSQAAPAAVPDASQYPEKIQRIVNDISQLTLLEVAELNKLLKLTLNISDVPVMAYGGGPAAAPAPKEEEEEAPAAKVQTAFTVKLMKFDDSKKVTLIKEIKNLVEGMNLVQAKKFVESAPAVVKADLSKEEAEKLKDALVAAGGVCEIS